MRLEEFANRKIDLMIEQPDGWREKLEDLEEEFFGDEEITREELLGKRL